MNVNEETKKRRGPKKYWITKNGKLYARLQYINEQGEYRDKYKPITDKRDARAASFRPRRARRVYRLSVYICLDTRPCSLMYCRRGVELAVFS